MKSLIMLTVAFSILCILCGCTTANQLEYKIQTEVYQPEQQSETISIKCPQIVFADGANANVINAILKKSALNDYFDAWETNGLTLTQTYSVKYSSDELLSIAFYGDAYVSGTAHPTEFCHSINIALDSGELINLSEYIASYEILEEIIIDGKYSVEYGGLKALSPDELLQIVRTQFEEVPINEHEKDFFVEEEKTISIIINNLSHSAGDYSIIELFLAD